jgi:hypothetical protein
MTKEEIADTAIKYVELCTLAVQAQHEYRPSPSAKRNSELALDYHEAMAEMARAELRLHDEVWRYKEEQMAKEMRDAGDPMMSEERKP